MATGKSYVPIVPGRVTAGMPRVRTVAEASSQTGLRGAPVVKTSGLLTQMAANGVLLSGFMVENMGNGSASAVTTGAYYEAGFDTEFKGTLKATLTQAMIGSVANLVEGSSTWYLDTSTSISSVAQVVIKDVADGFAVGDVNPTVYFTVIQADIEQS